jgi:DNA-binding SARP family transcriptional activator
MRFEILGTVRATVDGGVEPVPITAPRLRTVLAVLLWRSGAAVPIDELAELVWDGNPPKDAPGAIRALMARLRRTLGPRTGARIKTRGAGYAIEVAESELDASQYEALYRNSGSAVNAGRWPEAGTAAARALALWRGTPLADVPCQALRDAWVPGLQQMRVQLLEWRIEADLRLGRPDQVAMELRGLTNEHPLREHFHAQLMRALAATGRQAEALDAYRTARDVLIEELGIEPGPELRAVHQRILLGKTEPAPASPTTPTAPPSAATPDVPPRQLPAAPRYFTGRGDEVDWLHSIAERMQDDSSGLGAAATVVTIDGMAGVGKTALAVHVAHRLAGAYPDGQLFIDLHGYTPRRPPRSADEALEWLLQTMGVPVELIPRDTERAAALYRQRLAGTRTLIVLDNAATEGQIRPLLPGDGSCLVLVTSRRRLKGLDDACSLSLDVLPPSDAVTLLSHVAGRGRARPRLAGQHVAAQAAAATADVTAHAATADVTAHAATADVTAHAATADVTAHAATADDVADHAAGSNEPRSQARRLPQVPRSRAPGADRVPADDDPLLGEIAALCGHLPLALRIAGTLLRHRPAWDLPHLARLLRDHRSRVHALTDGERDLTTAFDLSYTGLDAQHRRLIRRLAWLSGTNDLDAVLAAAELDVAPSLATELLEDLVDHNLLRESSPGRYRLHDLVRAHARALSERQKVA